MRISLFLFSHLLSVALLAQNAPHQNSWYPLDYEFGKSSFTPIKLDKTEPGDIRDYILQTFDHLSHPKTDLEVQNMISSPYGTHYLYRQLFQKIPIYGSYVKLNVSLTGFIYAQFDGSRRIKALQDFTFPSNEVVSDYLATHQLHSEILQKLDYEQVFFPHNDTFIPALKMEVLTADKSFEVVLNNSGETIYFKDLIQYHYPADIDSVVTVGIFLPDPLTTAKVTYGSAYQDFGDSNLAILNAEIVNARIPVNYENGIFHLESPYVRITNYRNPSHIPATSTTPSFIYNRSEQEFEDVNVYYHIHTFQEYIQSLGFTNLANYQIHAETHASQADNSTFVGSANPPRLNFGEGGVDDGEDADVIIHEYGHAIQTSAAPNTISGLERKAIDEGNSDYLAATYSRVLDEYEWGNVFSWDGHNEFFAGRVVNSSKHYPEDLGAAYHLNGEIWSSALMEIWSELGPAVTDEILFQSLYGYAPNMNMSEAAMLFILADSLLNDGANFSVICNAFSARGFSTVCNNYVGLPAAPVTHSEAVTVVNSMGFSSGKPVTLLFEKEVHNGRLVIRDVAGKTIHQQNINNKTRISVSPEQMDAGIYLLSIESKSIRFTTRLVR